MVLSLKTLLFRYKGKVHEGFFAINLSDEQFSGLQFHIAYASKVATIMKAKKVPTGSGTSPPALSQFIC